MLGYMTAMAAPKLPVSSPITSSPFFKVSTPRIFVSHIYFLIFFIFLGLEIPLITFMIRAEFSTEEGGLSEVVIKKAFDATEEEFLHLVRQSWTSRPQIASVGSCCLVGVISNNVLYVANLGDSRAVLGKKVLEGQVNFSVVAERLSTDHNVAVEEVRKEVMALHPDDAHIVVYTRGVWRIKGIIQVLLFCRTVSVSSVILLPSMLCSVRGGCLRLKSCNFHLYIALLYFIVFFFFTCSIVRSIELVWFTSAWVNLSVQFNSLV